MTNERKMLTDKSPELAVENMKEALMARFGFTEERLDELDPYKWAGHDERYRLWVIRGYLELVEPKDPKIRFELLIRPSVIFSKQASFAFRHLDKKRRRFFQSKYAEFRV